jgi:hypothetical protein
MLFYSQACLDTDSFVACNWYFYLRFAVFFSSLLTFENHTFDIIPEPQQVVFLSFPPSQIFQNVWQVGTSGKMHATRRICVVLEAL